jgi:hypothetical protein
VSSQDISTSVKWYSVWMVGAAMPMAVRSSDMMKVIGPRRVAIHQRTETLLVSWRLQVRWRGR